MSAFCLGSKREWADLSNGIITVGVYSWVNWRLLASSTHTIMAYMVTMQVKVPLPYWTEMRPSDLVSQKAVAAV